MKLNFGPEAEKVLNEIHTLSRGSTVLETMRQIMGDALFFARKRAQGWRVCIEKDGEMREVIPQRGEP